MHQSINIATEKRLRVSTLTWVLVGLCCAMLAALALPSLLGHLPLRDDLGAFHYPLRVFYANQLAVGEAFDWWPNIYGGTYITGEGQLGGYHPWHLVLYRTLPVDVAFRLEVWSNYPLMLIGMVVLLRRLRFGWDGALFAALAFTASGFNLLHYVHLNAIAVVAHLPWMLWAADVALFDPRTRQRNWARLLFSLFLASQILLGYPQYVWICSLPVIGWSVWRWWSLRHRQDEDCNRRLAWLAVAGLLGVMIGAIQSVPTYDALQHSVRAEPDPAFAMSGSLHPLNLLQLVAPYTFENRVVGGNTHELGLYAGSVTLVLIVWLLCQWRYIGRLRPVAIASLWLTSGALLLASGEHGLVYRLQTWLPVVGSFRFPCRMIVLVHLGMALLAGIAWLMLVRRSHEINPPIATSWRPAALLLVGLSCAVPIGAQAVWPEHTSSWTLMLVGTLTVALAVALLSVAQRGHRWALILLALLAAIDWGCYGMSYALAPAEVTAVEIARETSDRVALNQLDSGIYRGNQMTIGGARRIDGYAGLEPAQRLDYSHIAALRLAGVHWVAADRHTAGLQPPQPTSTSELRPISNPLPRCWLVAETQQIGNLNQNLRHINPRRTALVDQAVHLSGAPDGSVRLARDRPGRLEFDIRPSSRQLLIVSESFHPGWVAQVDGRRVSPLPVYGDFIGIPVGKGDRLAELSFQPASLRVGGLVSGCGLVLLWAAFGCCAWRDRHTGVAGSTPLPTAI